MICNGPLMTPVSYLEFIQRYRWVPLSLSEDENALLTAGYLRTHGVVVRLEKKAPISMFGPAPQAGVLISEQDMEYATTLLEELKQNFTRCIICGHILSKEDQDCSFCVESTGAAEL